MPSHDPLPPCPAIRLEVSRRIVPAEARPFLDIERFELVAHYPDGSASAPFAYDVVTRRALDAVVIVAHFDRDGERFVFLRSALRPPLALRAAPPAVDAGLWELPAGLVEPGEDPRGAAARELEEEVGIRLEASALVELGGWALPAPGMVGERHVFFHAPVDPAAVRTPTEDGSALERFASIVPFALSRALAACRSGALRDEKTELGLRRLAELQ